jgi:hypothetical protein
MFRARRVFVCFSVILPLSISLYAEAPRRSAPIAAAATGEKIRFASTADVTQIRVQILSVTGETRFDSAWKDGNMLDWPFESPLPDGSYRCIVTVKDVGGQITQTEDILIAQGGQVSIEPRPENEDPKIALLVHDEKNGAIVNTSGDLIFRFGQFFAGKDTEKMRLTAEGNLDVTGFIRASKGIIFPDGTILATAGAANAEANTDQGKNKVTGSVLRLDPSVAAARLIPRPNAAGPQFVVNQTGVHIGTTNAFGLDVAGNVTLSSNLTLPASSATAGTIMLGANRFLHGYGSSNTFVGGSAGNYTMTGNSNTAVGDTSFTQNTVGIGNTAMGYWSAKANTTGSSNTAVGHFSLVNNTTGSNNIAIGKDAGNNLTAGDDNIDIGSPGSNESGTIRIGSPSKHTRAFVSGIYDVTSPTGRAVVVDSSGQLMTNPAMVATLGGEVTGPLSSNVVTNAVATNTFGAIVRRDSAGDFLAHKAGLSVLAMDGTSSSTAGLIMFSNLPFVHNYGSENTFVGASAGNFTMTGNSNTAVGSTAFVSNTSGIANTTSGYWGLHNNTTGSSNTAAGHFALVGNTTGSNNIGIGKDGGFNLTTGSNNIDIGNPGVAGEANTIRIGTSGTQTRAFIQGIRGVNTPGMGIPILVDINGQLGTNEGNGPTSDNVPNTLVLRDVNGSFAAGTITANLNGSATTFTSSLGGEVTGTQGNTVVSNATAVAAANSIVRRNGAGGFNAGYLALSAGGFVSIDNLYLHGGDLNTYLGVDTFSGAGAGNTGIGYRALGNNRGGTANTAVGENALASSTAGVGNVAVGSGTLASLTDASESTALGYQALGVTIAGGNTAVGYHALQSSTTGTANTAVGNNALLSNITGFGNTAVGKSALANNSATKNTALGWGSLGQNTSGSSNTAVGVNALAGSNGDANVGVGENALLRVTTGNHNIAIGVGAGQYITTGSDNLYIGRIGDPAAATHEKRIEIGEPGVHSFVYIHGIYNTLLGGADRQAVCVNEFGEMGRCNTFASSRRYKFDIDDMGNKTDDLMRLRPVTFKYRAQGPNGHLQYGLIAEEVGDIYPGLIVRDKDGRPDAVRYEFLAPMLLNEVQKQRNVIDELRAENGSLREQLEQLMRRVEHLELTR